MVLGLQKYRQTVIFFVGILGLYIAGVFIALLADQSYRDLTTAIALPVDLMIVIPALFYYFVVRKYKLTPLLVLPVIWVGSAVITQIVQPQNMQFVTILMAITFAVEIVIGIHEIRRIVFCYKEIKRTSDDPRIWFEETFFALTRSRNASKLAAAELTTTWYALFSWRKKVTVESGAESFSYHKESGYSALIVVLIGIAGIEISVVHLLLSQWNITVAFIVTVLSAYGVLWLLGDMRASVLRPIKVGQDYLEINSGIRVSVRIPLRMIESVRAKNPELTKEETLNLAMMNSDNCWIILKEGVRVEGIFGGKCSKRSFGLTLDNVDEFKRALQKRLEKTQDN